MWFDEEYVPVSELIASGELLERGETETDAYLRVAADRYLLLRTHRWDETVLEALREQMKQPNWEDTEVRRLRRTFR